MTLKITPLIFNIETRSELSAKHVPFITALWSWGRGKGRWISCEFEAGLVYIVGSTTARDRRETLPLRKEINNKIKWV